MPRQRPGVVTASPKVPVRPAGNLAYLLPGARA